MRAVRNFLAGHRTPPGRSSSPSPADPTAWPCCEHCLAAGIKQVVVAHLNHGLRGAESDADEAFVANLARRFRLALSRRSPQRRHRCGRRQPGGHRPPRPLRVVSRGCPGSRRRLGRHRPHRRRSGGNGAVPVASRHRARRAGRDRGVAGRSPMAVRVGPTDPDRDAGRRDRLTCRNSVRIIGTDATNADTTRTRSRIRHELLPLLARQYNPRVVEALGRLAAQAADWRRDQAAIAAELLRLRAELPRAGPVLVFDRRHWPAHLDGGGGRCGEASGSAKAGRGRRWAFANGTGSPAFAAAGRRPSTCPAASGHGGSAP